MKGYKAFNKDMTCRDFQFEVGKTYKHEGKIIPCQSGFHFCKSLADCYQFYPMNEKTIICKIEALGEVKTDDGVKFCTNEIKIVSKVNNPRTKSNTNESCSGYRNSGNCNSGNRNSGNCNSGNCNSGNRNSGNCNSGNCNSGNRNSGNWNSGDCNSGNCNSGNRNSGNCNSGNCNSGNRNSGDWNSGYRNSGIFCTEKEPKMKFFDKDSDWTMRDWLDSYARRVMDSCPISHDEWVDSANMTEEEKAENLEYKTTGGFLKHIKVDKQAWWNELSESDKNEIYALPNFDKEKFEKCVGVKVR